LDIPEKLEHFRTSVMELVPNKSDYHVLRIDQYGVAQENPPSQALATSLFRIFGQADTPEALSTLREALVGYGLGGYCGEHSCMDFRLVGFHIGPPM
jgi:predicted alpha/beta hydrolase